MLKKLTVLFLNSTEHNANALYWYTKCCFCGQTNESENQNLELSTPQNRSLTRVKQQCSV